MWSRWHDCGRQAARVNDRFLYRLPNLEWAGLTADSCGNIKAEHRRLGKLVVEIDTQIAAHALSEGLVTVIHNFRHLQRVPYLELEDWTN